MEFNHRSFAGTEQEPGFRILIRHEHHGESWVRFVAIPRSEIIRRIQRLRKLGMRWSQIAFWDDLMPYRAFMPVDTPEPGRAFHRNPVRLARKNRRFVCFAQSGGLDI